MTPTDGAQAAWNGRCGGNVILMNKPIRPRFEIYFTLANMNSSASIPFELLIRRALAIGIASAVIGFIEHQAYGWIPSPLSHWLALRKEEIAAAENLQYFGLAALGLSGLVATLVTLGREPVFSSQLLRQSIGQVLNVGGAFVGLIVGLACSVAVAQGLAAAATGFLLAVFAAVFIGGVPMLSFALFQFPTMAFRAKWAEPYRKHISVSLGVFVFATAAWGLGTDMLANPTVQGTLRDKAAQHP